MNTDSFASVPRCPDVCGLCSSPTLRFFQGVPSATKAGDPQQRPMDLVKTQIPGPDLDSPISVLSGGARVSMVTWTSGDARGIGTTP